MDLLRLSSAYRNEVPLSLVNPLFAGEARNSNVVISPLSLHVVLSLIAAGSSGRTLEQFLTFLKADSIDELNTVSSKLAAHVFADGSRGGGPRLSFVNGVWVDLSMPFKPSFKHIVDNIYTAVSKQVDFQTKAAEVGNEVNSWAENETSGLIKEILPPGEVDESTRLIFANALYFKGAWDEKFEASATKDHKFHLLDGSFVQVPFMTSEKKQVVGAYDGFKVLELPYKESERNRRFSMYIFLPDTVAGLPSLIERISSESEFINKHTPYRKVELGEFRIPKFKTLFGFEAKKILKELGLELPFSGEGLTEIVDSPEGQHLYVSKIFHKSFIEVNEEGTEAAAATAGIVKLGSAWGPPPEKLDFVADHPFVFFIKEHVTCAILFIGQVCNPLQSD